MSKKRHARKYLLRDAPEPRDTSEYQFDFTESWVRNFNQFPAMWEDMLLRLEAGRSHVPRQLDNAASHPERAFSQGDSRISYTDAQNTSDSMSLGNFYEWTALAADALGVLPEGMKHNDGYVGPDIPPAELSKRLKRALQNISQKLSPINLAPQQSGGGGGGGDGEGDSSQENEEQEDKDEIASDTPNPRPQGMGGKNPAQRGTPPEEDEDGEGNEEDSEDSLEDALDNPEKLPYPKYGKSPKGQKAQEKEEGEEQEEQEGEGEGEGSGSEEDDEEEEEQKSVSTALGGGGKQIRAEVSDETHFYAARQAILNLAVAPDVMNREELGDDVIEPRRLLAARYNPAILLSLRKELGKTIDDVYIILDTSGSVSAFADKIATIAAAAAGIVHLYSGSEARPQYKVNRSTPLASPSSPFPEWEDQEPLWGEDDKEASAFAEQFTKENYDGFVDEDGDAYGGNSFEEDVAWWLECEKPPIGSHIIFWTDTHGCGILRPTLLKSLLSNYHVTLMLPQTRDEALYYYDSESMLQYMVENGLKDNGNSRIESYKFQAMDVPVLYDVKDGASFAEALRFVK